MNSTTQVARILLQLLFNMKMYHWATQSYARHVASDAFNKEFHGLVDRFIETMSTRHGRVVAGGAPVTDQPISAVSDEEVSGLLDNFVHFLLDELEKTLDRALDPDLVSMRDDMLALTRQTLYLFTLS